MQRHLWVKNGVLGENGYAKGFWGENGVFGKWACKETFGLKMGF